MAGNTQITSFIILAWIGILLLVITVILFAYNYRVKMLQIEKEKHKIENEKQLIAFKASIDAEERQKGKIAYNLHDEIIPLLSALGQNIENHKAEFKNRTLTENVFTYDSLLIDKSIAGIRTIALDLVPTTLLNFGLFSALEQHVIILNNGASSIIEFENKSQFLKEIPFTKNDELNIYRIFLEILNNIRKHDSFSYMRILIETIEGQLSIEFRHDGKGVTNENIEALGNANLGLGLRSLKSRLFILSAVINYIIESDNAVIHLLIPFNNETNN